MIKKYAKPIFMDKLSEFANKYENVLILTAVVVLIAIATSSFFAFRAGSMGFIVLGVLLIFGGMAVLVSLVKLVAKKYKVYDEKSFREKELAGRVNWQYEEDEHGNVRKDAQGNPILKANITDPTWSDFDPKIGRRMVGFVNRENECRNTSVPREGPYDKDVDPQRPRTEEEIQACLKNDQPSGYHFNPDTQEGRMRIKEAQEMYDAKGIKEKITLQKWD